MRLRNVKGSRDVIAQHKDCIKDETEQKGKWHEIFANDHPIRIEIGMGKGQFLTTLAQMHPEINYVGIEKYSSVLIRALEKQDELQLPNLRMIRMEAEYIADVFDRDEVDRIYLNFSDPWPKDRHAKRRLTSSQFLSRYDKILIPDGVVEFKTDNGDLFAFSLEEAKASSWNILMETKDLHNSPYIEGNIMTEYEARFVEEGKPICKMIISRN